MKPIRVLGNKNLGIWTINLVAYGRLTYLFVQASVFGFHYQTLYRRLTHFSLLLHSHWMEHSPFTNKCNLDLFWLLHKIFFCLKQNIRPHHFCVKLHFLYSQFPHLMVAHFWIFNTALALPGLASQLRDSKTFNTPSYFLIIAMVISWYCKSHNIHSPKL